MQLDDWEDHNPFENDWTEATKAGYEDCIRRGDGLVEVTYHSVMLELFPAEFVDKFRNKLVGQLSKKVWDIFSLAQNEYLQAIERREKYRLDKKNKIKPKSMPTNDPIAAGKAPDVPLYKAPDKKPAKRVEKPSKAVAQRYANEDAKRNTKQMF